ncbi:hypothetical protein BH23CHL8_BH23CHL8_18840 [soil metagenome]
MQALAEPFASALATGYTAHARLSALAGANDPAVVRTWEAGEAIIISGSVQLDRTRQVRGTSSLDLADHRGQLVPRDVVDTFADRSLLRVERGIEVGGNVAWVPLATYVVDRSRGSMAGRLALSGQDRLTLAQQAFGEPLTLDTGMRVGDAIRAWLEPVLGTDDELWGIDDGSLELGAPVTVSEDDQRLDRAMALAADHALELLTDRTGRVVLRPKVDPTTAAAVLSIERGRTILGHEREVRAIPVNRAVAIGDPLTGRVYRGVAEVTDPASPLHPDRIGLLVAPPHRSSAIASQYQADQVAWQLLIESALVEEETVTRLLADPRLDEGDVVILTEPHTATSGSYRVDRLDMPVLGGEMSITATRTRSLLA